MLVKLLGEDAILIVQHEAAAMMSRDRFPQLLQYPLGCGVCRHIGVPDTSSRMFQEYKDIQETKGRGEPPRRNHRPQ
jgi:hypothetical protein